MRNRTIVLVGVVEACESAASRNATMSHPKMERGSRFTLVRVNIRPEISMSCLADNDVLSEGINPPSLDGSPVWQGLPRTASLRGGLFAEEFDPAGQIGAEAETRTFILLLQDGALERHGTGRAGRCDRARKQTVGLLDGQSQHVRTGVEHLVVQ